MPHAQSSESAAAASAVPVGTPGGAITSLDLSHHTPSPPCSPDPEGTVAARDAREQRRVSAVLGGLPRGSRVAILSLLGSLNPITLGHVQMITEARRVCLANENGRHSPPLPSKFCLAWPPSQLLFCEYHCISTLTNARYNQHTVP